ncbi:MAG: UDP-N-acetylglucosamine 2-epimerase (non-hydrolyzing) [Pseudomonadota bacterium]
MKLLSVAGARPNFMKIAALSAAVANYNLTKERLGSIHHIIVHTGQHYDKKMSQSFFDELEIPKPDINLEVGSGSHARQTAEIMMRFEHALLQEKPDVLLVVGDVNSTIACALVAAKIQYSSRGKRTRPLIVHVEAGLRSFDIAMPEEVNRVLTDSISDILFVTEPSAFTNLQREGVSEAKIHYVGNVMIDTLKRHLEQAKKSSILQSLGVSNKYALVTLHRPSNVDNLSVLRQIIDCLMSVSQEIPLVFPVHPRTKNKLIEFGLFNKLKQSKNITLSEPLGYLDFLNLITNATLVITDSGGIQEETTFLKIPCVTLRENTERPVTVKEGSNYLIGTKGSDVLETISLILSGQGKISQIPQYWDGMAGDRIISILAKEFFHTAERG